MISASALTTLTGYSDSSRADRRKAHRVGLGGKKAGRRVNFWRPELLESWYAQSDAISR